jgi:hypothetical protein
MKNGSHSGISTYGRPAANHMVCELQITHTDTANDPITPDRIENHMGVFSNLEIKTSIVSSNKGKDMQLAVVDNVGTERTAAL